MVPLVLVCILTVASKNVAGQWSVFNGVEYSETPDEYSEEIDLGFDSDLYDDSAWFQQIFENREEDNINKYLETRGIPMPSSNTRKNNGGCVEREETHDINIEGEIFPVKYRNISCESADKQLGHHQHLRGMLSTCVNPECHTVHKLVPIFKKIHGLEGKECWKHVDSITVQSGCKCHH